MSPRFDYYMPPRALVQQTGASIVEPPRIPRSRFVNPITRLTAFDADYLVPFYIDEVLPGDHIKLDVHAYVRMATPLFPNFSQMKVETFFFYVPNRLLWNHWVNFMGEQATPASSIAYTIPQMESQAGGYDVGSLQDHLGLPTTGQLAGAGVISHSALYTRAYYLIYREWFRDENIIDSPAIDIDDGPDTYSDYVLQKRAKSPDYFTKALPWPQKFTAPTISIGTRAAVLGIGTDTAIAGAGASAYDSGGSHPTYANAYTLDSSGEDPATTKLVIQQQLSGGNYYPDIYADLTTATGLGINSLRQAIMVQSLLERDARGGTRYIEILKAHFGVTSPDFRLQRPEYIGGGSSPLNVTPIAQTAPTTGVPLGALGGAGTAYGQHHASYAATEHGIILGIINVRAELAYQQGVAKQFSRLTRYDFYDPALAMLGEQAVSRVEIYARGDSNDSTVFGYVPRWEEYRQRYSDVTGIMRSTAANTIDGWHLTQKFTSAPTLSKTFIESAVPMTRILAAGNAAIGQEFIADILIHRDMVRPIPMFGTPATLGRF